MAVKSKHKADAEKFKTEVKKRWDITDHGPIEWRIYMSRHTQRDKEHDVSGFGITDLEATDEDNCGPA